MIPPIRKEIDTENDNFIGFSNKELKLKDKVFKIDEIKQKKEC